MKLDLSKKIALYVAILVMILSSTLGIISYKLSSDSLVSQSEKSLTGLVDVGSVRIKDLVNSRLGLLQEIANSDNNTIVKQILIVFIIVGFIIIY